MVGGGRSVEKWAVRQYQMSSRWIHGRVGLDAGGTGSSKHGKDDGKALHHRYSTEQKRL